MCEKARRYGRARRAVEYEIFQANSIFVLMERVGLIFYAHSRGPLREVGLCSATLHGLR
jgi:hypothetical protein